MCIRDRPQTESYNRHVGIMYCGKYAKTPQGGEDSFLYVAMNMHLSLIHIYGMYGGSGALREGGCYR